MSHYLTNNNRMNSQPACKSRDKGGMFGDRTKGVCCIPPRMK